MPPVSVPSAAAPPPGLLLVGHGTRSVRGQAEFLELGRQVAGRLPGWEHAAALLELAEPTIPCSLDHLLARGCKRLVVAPLLLFSAGHAQLDVPEAVRAALAGVPVRWTQAAALGCHPLVVAAAADRCGQALAGGTLPDSQTMLLAVGRGSRDPLANAEFARLARLVFEARPVAWLGTCCLAMAEPSLERAVELAAHLPLGQILVQPHLLFHGDLADRVAAVVSDCRRRHPERRWLLADYLGPDPRIAQAVAELAQAALHALPDSVPA